MNTKNSIITRLLNLPDEFYVKAYISFDEWTYIPKEKFEWIEEWHAESDRKYLIGVLSFNELKINLVARKQDFTDFDTRTDHRRC